MQGRKFGVDEEERRRSTEDCFMGTAEVFTTVASADRTGLPAKGPCYLGDAGGLI